MQAKISIPGQNRTAMNDQAPDNTRKKNTYMAPQLMLYGGLGKLTAAGSMGVPETYCASYDPRATNMNKIV